MSTPSIPLIGVELNKNERGVAGFEVEQLATGG